MANEFAQEGADTTQTGGLQNARVDLYQSLNMNEAWERNNSQRTDQTLPTIQIFDPDATGDGTASSGNATRPSDGKAPGPKGDGTVGTGSTESKPKSLETKDGTTSTGSTTSQPDSPIGGSKTIDGSKYQGIGEFLFPQQIFPKEPTMGGDPRITQHVDKQRPISDMVGEPKDLRGNFDEEHSDQLAQDEFDRIRKHQEAHWQNPSAQSGGLFQEAQDRARQAQFEKQFGNAGENKPIKFPKAAAQHNGEVFRREQARNQIERTLGTGSKNNQPLDPGKKLPDVKLPFLDPQPSPLDHPRRRR